MMASRAGEIEQRQLTRARDADDRRHLLDLAECYKRAADQVAPPARSTF
jgi:hypothetical protein